MQLLTTYVQMLIDSDEWTVQELYSLLKHIDTDRNIQAFRKVKAGVYSNEDLIRVKTIYTGRLMLQILLDRADNDELFKTVRVLDKALGWIPDWEGALWEVKHAVHVVQTKQSIARLMKLGASQEKADFCMMLAEQHLRERFRHLYRRVYDQENSRRMDEDVRVFEYDGEPDEHSVWCRYGHPVHEKVEELAARLIKTPMEKLRRFEAYLDR